MDQKIETNKKLVSLRQRAEEMMQEDRSASENLSGQDAEALLEELRVHHIELELQNQELQEAQIALQFTRDRYLNLYDFAPVGYFTLSPENLIQEVNLTGAALLGIERKFLLNKPLT